MLQKEMMCIERNYFSTAFHTTATILLSKTTKKHSEDHIRRYQWVNHIKFLCVVQEGGWTAEDSRCQAITTSLVMPMKAAWRSMKGPRAKQNSKAMWELTTQGSIRPKQCICQRWFRTICLHEDDALQPAQENGGETTTYMTCSVYSRVPAIKTSVNPKCWSTEEAFQARKS